jgi:hypothetical protein
MDYNAKYQEISKHGLPKQLTLQQMVVNGPPGRVFCVSFMWSSESIEEGYHWCNKITCLGTVIMNTVEVTTIPKWYSGNTALIPSTMYGSFRTHSVKNMTQEVTACIGRSLEKLPADPGTMFSIHQLRDTSETPASASVFSTREPHFILEIVGCATTTEKAEASEQWAFDTWAEVKNTNSSNLLDRVYISLDHVKDPCDLHTLTRYFGDYTQDILTAKKDYDPDNVFGLTVPRLGNLL